MIWRATLETERLYLRPLAAIDLPDLVREIGRWDVARFLIRVPHPYDPADARRWLAQCEAMERDRRQYHRVAVPRGGGALLGAAGLMLDAHGPGVAELGYWLAQPVWRRGYGTEMVQAMCDSGFRDLGLGAITAAVDPANDASNALARRLGFRLERVEPSHDRGLRGPPAPAHIWRLDREGWETTR